jgi:hypothetical protein
MMDNENKTGGENKKLAPEEQSEDVSKPFDLDEALRDENVKAAEGDAATEQQRKEAMTERD